MAPKNLSLNLLNFSFPENSLSFYFSSVGHPMAVQLSVREIEFMRTRLNIPAQEEVYYTSFDFFTGAGELVTLAVDAGIDENQPNWPKSLLKKYLIFKLKQYFKNEGLITRLNFTSDLEVWLPGKSVYDSCRTYKGFTLRVQFEKLTDKPELLIVYNGLHHVLKQPIDSEIFEELCPDQFSWLMHENTLFRMEDMPDDLRRNTERIFPCLNKKLHSFLEMPILPPEKQNRYKFIYREINSFSSNYFKSEKLKDFILIDLNPVTRPSNSIYPGNETLSQLKFGNNGQSNERYLGLKNFGPVVYTPNTQTVFFFIMHQDDIPMSYLLNDYLKGKGIGFAGISKFAGINYSTKENFSIVFGNKDNPLPEVIRELNKRKFENDICYVAIYLSPHPRWTQNAEHKRIYYQLKEELLHRGIISQTLEVEKNWPEKIKDANGKAIVKPGFNFFMPNIAVSLLAKMGGVPWNFSGEAENELVIGISAFRSEMTGQRYLGSAFSFSGEGRFYGFDCFQHNQMEELTGSILLAVKSFCGKHDKLKRLVIHFYKTMSRKELKPIENGLESLGLQIPVIVVSINKSFSEDIIGFDLNNNLLMPESFTYLSVGKQTFLLYNNSLHSTLKFSGRDGYPLPMKVSVQYHPVDSEIIGFLSKEEIEKLFVQICKFSQLYWKSVSFQPLPVTLRYPEMLAQIVPHFTRPELPRTGKETLWFL